MLSLFFVILIGGFSIFMVVYISAKFGLWTLKKTLNRSINGPPPKMVADIVTRYAQQHSDAPVVSNSEIIQKNSAETTISK